MAQRRTISEYQLAEMSQSNDLFHRFLFYTYRAQSDLFEYKNFDNSEKIVTNATEWVNLREMLNSSFTEGPYDQEVEQYLHCITSTRGIARDRFLTNVGVNFRRYKEFREIELNRNINVASLLENHMTVPTPPNTPQVAMQAPAVDPIPPNAAPVEPAVPIDAPVPVAHNLLGADLEQPHGVTERFDLLFPEPAERHLIVQHVLKENHREKSIKIVPANGRSTTWWHFITALAGPISWNNFTRNVPNKQVFDLVQSIGGTASTGIKWLVRKLYEESPSDVISGVQAGGGTAYEPLTPIETLGFMGYCGVTLATFRKVAQFLKHHNGGTSVFASEKRCNQLRVPDQLPYSFGEYEYLLLNGETEETVTVPFRVSCPFDTFCTLLRSVRDGGGTDTIGVNFGPTDGTCIGCTVMGDHGANATQCIQVLHARELDRQRVHINIGSMPAKEEYHILDNTMLPVIDNGVRKLQEHAVLVISWGENEFDFAVLPTLTLLTSADLSMPPGLAIDRTEDRKVRLRWDNQEKILEKSIPLEGLTLRYLPIKVFHNGDLSWTSTVQERPNSSNHKCLFCNTNHSKFQDAPHRGDVFTSAQIHAHVTSYRLTHQPAAPGEPDPTSLPYQEAAYTAALTGWTHYALLFRYHKIIIFPACCTSYLA